MGTAIVQNQIDGRHCGRTLQHREIQGKSAKEIADPKGDGPRIAPPATCSLALGRTPTALEPSQWVCSSKQHRDYVFARDPGSVDLKGGEGDFTVTRHLSISRLELLHKVAFERHHVLETLFRETA